MDDMTAIQRKSWWMAAGKILNGVSYKLEDGPN